MEKKKLISRGFKSKIFLILVIILVTFSGVIYGAANESTDVQTTSRFLGMMQTTLVYGVFYALMALGFALIFGAARVVNLYHGTFYMLGAYFFATLAAPSNFKFPTFWFIFFQLLIVISIGMFFLKQKKQKEEAKKPFIKKFSVPIFIIVFAQIPLLLLFLRVDLPSVINFNLIVAIIFVTGIIGAISIAINKYLIEPVREQGVTVLIITIALAFFTERLLDAVYGASSIPVPSFVAGKPLELFGGSVIDARRFLMFIIGIILIVLVWLLMNKTKLGKGVLAVAQDKEAATLMGINPKFVYAFAIALSAILAAYAGIFTTPFLGDAAPNIWLGPLIKAFAIVILGGLGSIFGSVLAAFILAFVEKFTKYYISSSLEEIVFLIVIIVILLIRPQGLFGKKGRI